MYSAVPIPNKVWFKFIRIGFSSEYRENNQSTQWERRNKQLKIKNKVYFRNIADHVLFDK